MVLTKGSRYEKVRTYNYLHPDKGLIPTFIRRRPLKIPPDSAVIRHQVLEKERLDFLAYHYLGDSRLWWVILEANPQYVTPWDVRAGDIIYVPTAMAYRKAVQQYGL